MNQLVFDDALKIEVQHQAFRRMHLHVFKDALPVVLADLDVEHAREERLVFHLVHQ